MIQPEAAAARLEALGVAPWSAIVAGQLHERLVRRPHGDMPRWQAALDALPDVAAGALQLDRGLVSIGRRQDTDADTRTTIERGLRELMPWRKGPYQVHGVFIDTEWRSDWKWDRLLPHIEPLAGRRVLDIGCGNGYHCWRALGEGARAVVGVDPTVLFLAQFEAIRHFVAGCPGAPVERIMQLPLGVEHLPPGMQLFDTLFSMGVLYHRRAPIDHLLALRAALRPGGQLVLETLVVPGVEGYALLPADRYARMRNVWFIPSTSTLEGWLRRCGFSDVRTVDVAPTSTGEQRTTDWMQFESLAASLDSAAPELTVEGYPAPLRAVVVAHA